jgi:hypothetical protein
VPLLRLAEAIENADEVGIDALHRELGVEIETVHYTYSDALAWAEKII